MKYLHPVFSVAYFALCFLLVSMWVTPVFADGVAFFPIAQRIAESPPELSSLSVLCKKKSPDGGYVNFLGGDDGKVRLVVFTEKRIKKLSKIVMLKVGFFTHPSSGLPVPTARPTLKGALDWAYVFDRNSDGQIDYMTYLYSAIPVMGDDFPEDFPKSVGGSTKYDLKAYQHFVRKTELVFSHHADDNHDGAIDFIVASVHSSEYAGWVEGYGVLRSTNFDGVLDMSWTFVRDISQPTGKVEKNDDGYVLQNDVPDRKMRTAEEWLEFTNFVLQRTNKFITKCKLSGSLYQPE